MTKRPIGTKPNPKLSDELLKTESLSKGSQYNELYANIDYLAPGAKSCKFHSHTKQDEFFYILKGACIVRVGNEIHRLNTGDYFCKPAGQNIAHQFINDSSDIVEILDVGTNKIDDIITYPDEDVVWYKEHNKILKNNVEMYDWNSDPN